MGRITGKAGLFCIVGTSDQDTDRGFESSFAGREAGRCERVVKKLFKIESYVEMALNYLRFEEMSNDLVLERNSLEQLVRQVVKKYATIFIYNHISIQLEHLDYTVLTDEKWFLLYVGTDFIECVKIHKAGKCEDFGGRICKWFESFGKGHRHRHSE